MKFASIRVEDKNNMTIFDEIRAKAKQVALAAKHITIRKDRIATYIQQLPTQKIDNPPLDPTCHYVGYGYDTLSFFLSLEAINFGSGYFPYLKNSVEGSGYFTVAKAWKKYYDKHAPIAATTLAQLTTADCLQIFGQEKDNIPIRELMTHFAIALNQLGEFLLIHFDGQVRNLFEEANHSAEKLVQLLIQMPYFQDIATYGTLQVPILKRAQITAADISLAFQHQGLGYFKDIDQLTIFADNMVPHVLRCDGILAYEKGLAAMVDAQQLVPKDSEEEIEIRACAIHTVELMRAAFAQIGHTYTSVDLDYLLWNRGLPSYYEQKHAIHLTRTIFY